jgi:flagellar biosynthesis protein FlhG
MVSAHADQAEGLRRMLSFARTRTVAVVAGTRGAGTTTCVVNLGAALARQGRRVLTVDENYGANISQALGLRPRFDLKQAIAGDCDLSDVLLHSAGGVAVLTAAGAARALPQLDAQGEARAIRCFAQLDNAADIVLLDVCNDADEPSPFAAAAQEVIVVVSPGSSSITGGYAAVKRMSQTHGRKRFRLLVNRANDDATARLVQANMTHVAAKHLGVALEYMGAIPLDPVVHASARRFSAAVDAAPTAAASRRFCEHGATMLRWSVPQNEVSRLDNFMQRAIYGSRFQAVGAGV